MIVSFKDKETEKIFNQEFSKKLPVDIQIIAFRKLQRLDRFLLLEDLAKIPGNNLEKLKGRENSWSIRINKQWRIVFKVNENNDFEDVEIVDYH